MSTVKANTIEPASGGTVTITGAALTTPALGTPASGNLANCTGLPASAVANTPAGGISATTVQGALNELDSEKASSTMNALTPSGGTLAITGALSVSGEASVTGNLSTSGTVVAGGAGFFFGDVTARLSAASNSTPRGLKFAVTADGSDYGGIQMYMTTGELRYSAGYATWGGWHSFYGNGVKRWEIATSTGHWLPGADNTYNHGSGSYAIKQIYTVNSVIVTSDARLKTTRPYSVAERAVAQRIKALGLVYQWNDAIATKGADLARLHFGVTVQSVIAAFEAEGLDPMRYGVVCYDEWQAEVIEHPAMEARDAMPAVPEVWEEVEVDITIRVNGEDRPAKRTVLRLVQPAVPAQPAVQAREAWTETVREAGNRYSLRLDQLAFFIATAGAGV